MHPIRQDMEALAFRALSSLPNAAVLAYDPELCVTMAVGGALEREGFDRVDIVGRTIEDVLPGIWRPRLEPSYRAALAGRPAEIELRLPSGAIFHLGFSPIRDEAGEVSGGLVIAEELSGRRRTEAALREAADRFEQAFAMAPIGMALVAPDGGWVKVNAALCELTGYTQDELLARTFQDITHPDDLDADLEQVERLLAGEIRGYRMEKRYVTAAGELVWVWLSGSLVRDADGVPIHFIAHIQDITERKRTESDLAHLASHDPLTGLWNRRRFEEELHRQAERVRRYGETGALMLLDLDNFKYVNDTLGHQAGDRVIGSVARTLAGRMRHTDALARIGGDEFALLAVNVSAAQADALAQDLAETVRQAAVEVDGETLRVTCSVGVALLSGEEGSEQDALKEADVAMYEAKRSGRDRARAFDATSGVRVSDGLKWSRRLRDALDQDAFLLHAQPVIGVRDREIVHHELLLRLPDPEDGVVAPGAFLYSAERFGLMNEIDRWVVRRAAAEVAQRSGRRVPFRVSVNLSGRSVADPALGDYIESVLAEAGADPRDFTFEVTETEAIAEMEHARNLARRLTRLGCRFSLDDFGSGFASYYYLKALPFDEVKIDGEFVRFLPDNPTDQLVVRALVDVARGMGKRTVAEFVGNDAVMDCLAEIGVDLAQGFHVGRPEPLASL